MASPHFNLDELQQQMQTLLPPIASASHCCCLLLGPSLQPNDHLDDCELRLLDHGSSDSSTKDNNAAHTEVEASARRRKHRESMARLRRGWRTSIAALQHEEKQLQALLRRTIGAPAQNDSDDASRDGDANPLEAMRRSYRELVEEQLRLQAEHVSLEAARAHKEKYERLLERELERVRIFNATGDQNDA